MPTGGDDNNGKVTVAVLGERLNTAIGMMEKAVFLSERNRDAISRQDVVIGKIQTELQDFVEFKRALIRQIAAIVVAGAGISSLVTYLIQNMSK